MGKIMCSRINLINRIVILSIVCLFIAGTMQAATFTVDRILDGSDINPGNGICATAVGNCTFRAAIEEANAFPGTDLIYFAITGPNTIKILTPATLYPTITQPVIIDGFTQGVPGYTGDPLIEIDGTNTVAGASGLDVTAGSSTIRGLAINRFGFYGINLRTNGGNAVEGCYLGTDASGMVDLGNGIAGINIASSNNVIGGTSGLKRNVISGNNGTGIAISATGNVVSSNYIGTNAAGNAVLGNTDSGILISSSGNTIGGTTPSERNIISGNGDNLGVVGGIILNAGGNIIIGNYIGTDTGGTADLGNKGDGIRVNGATATNNQIGGTLAGEANTIAFNVYGISFLSNTATGNSIRQNSIFSNDNLGITLSFGGVTPNDAGDADTGANNLQNFPVLTSASRTGGITTILGSLNSTPSTAFTIEFFSSPSCDPSGNGEGQTFLGDFPGTTDAGGNFTFAVGFGTPVVLGSYITSTATRNVAPLDTSEFSECVQVVNGSSPVVTNTLDSGVGSLRQAIINTNAAAGLDQITFNIPGAGVQTINLLSALPTITDPVVIKGSTQPGFAGMPLIELNGAGAGVGESGLVITAGGSTVSNLIINRFGEAGILLYSPGGNVIRSCFIGTDSTGTIDLGNVGSGISIASATNRIGGGSAATRNVISGNNGTGISISSSFATGNIVSGNYIGTTVDGTAALPNSGIGIYILGGSSGNTIGGTTAGERNVISGNGSSGVYLSGFPSDAGGNIITGNFIGTAANGTAALGNASGGIFVNDSSNNQIGGTSASQRNIISGNLSLGGTGGISISGALSTGNTVTGNYIGTDAGGTGNLGNLGKGISVSDAPNNRIGGTTAGEGNIVAFNGGIGVYINQIVGMPTGNSILGNSIFSNSGLGIDLAVSNISGVTANDANDVDTGANNLQNYPVITGALTGSTRVIGTFNSTPGTQFRLEFFNSPTADASGNGEGQFFVGAINVTTNGAGNAAFDQTFAYVSAPNSFVSATATDLTTGDTSEFSVAKQVLAPSAANATLSGRVMTADGRGIRGARVSLTSAAGFVRYAVTSSFGYYSFTDVTVGETYVLSVISKRYQFNPQIVSIFDELNEIDLIAMNSQ